MKLRKPAVRRRNRRDKGRELPRKLRNAVDRLAERFVRRFLLFFQRSSGRLFLFFKRSSGRFLLLFERPSRVARRLFLFFKRPVRLFRSLDKLSGAVVNIAELVRIRAHREERVRDAGSEPALKRPNAPEFVDVQAELNLRRRKPFDALPERVRQQLVRVVSQAEATLRRR